MLDPGMKLPSEYSFSVTPVRNADGELVRPDYVKWAEWYCEDCGYVLMPSHGVTEGFLNQMINAYNQNGPCPKCGAENKWNWRRIEELGHTVIEGWTDAGGNDKAASAGSGAAAGGADLTHA